MNRLIEKLPLLVVLVAVVVVVVVVVLLDSESIARRLNKKLLSRKKRKEKKKLKEKIGTVLDKGELLQIAHSNSLLLVTALLILLLCRPNARLLSSLMLKPFSSK